MEFGRRVLEVGLLVIGLSLWTMTRPQAQPVWLFPTKMDADCVRDVQPVLTREAISYRIAPSGQGLEIRREDRPRAQVALALAGLPRHRMVIHRDPNVLGGTGPTEELLRIRAQEAETVISQVLSAFPGIQSVRVGIKRGDEAAFTENRKPDQVRIWLRGDASLSPRRMAAIGWLALLDYGDTRDPFTVEIREEGTGRLLWSNPAISGSDTE